ncbi:MAG: hypothetical protein JNM26_11160 [Ideonella sp.]|nr:hypothetical protein [Ideonella sp.]
MGHNALLGIDHAPTHGAHRDADSLGPSDSSDSGSDVAGLEATLDRGDPAEPVDVALQTDVPRTWASSGDAAGAATDASGTGEGRAAAGDAGAVEGADIGVDRIIDPLADHDDEDPDLAFIDQVLADAEAPDGRSSGGDEDAKDDLDDEADRAG